MIWPFGATASDLAVQPIGVGAARQAADIHAALFARPWTDGEIGDLIAHDNVMGFAAMEPPGRGGTMVGFILARHAASEAEILTVAVRPDWQRHGVGRRLLDQLLAHVHRERIEALFLEVDETNAAALTLYGKVGFRIVGERPDYYLQGGNGRGRAIVMRRDTPTKRPRP